VTDSNVLQALAPDSSMPASVLDQLPNRWFELAQQLYPGLTAPGVRLLRQSEGSEGASSDLDLERAALARVFKQKN